MTAIFKKAIADKEFKKHLKFFIVSLLMVSVLVGLLSVVSFSTTVDPPTSPIPETSGDTNPGISITVNGADTKTDRVEALDILFLMTLLALLPSILIMLTAFTRIVIVLSFVRNAMGLQQTPPNQVIIGLALFLTLFVMSPVLTEIKEVAYTP